MSKLQVLRPYLLGALGLAPVIAIVSPEVRSAAAALVLVTNTSANPVPTKAADNAAFTAWGTRLFPNVRNYASFTVPAGKYLVINDISGFNNGTTAQDMTIYVTSNGASLAKAIPFTQQSRGLWYLDNSPVFLVADPGSTVYATINDSNLNDGAGINIDIHGYYVPQN